jgi:FtsP/CotA-like multicopper oxidase with cupredoxin domain
MIDRRSLLKHTGLVPFMGAVPRLALAADEITNAKADYTLRIGTGLVELAPEHIVSTTLYNGQFPGPLLRFKEGQQVVVDVHNDTDTPELVHWHGQMISSNVDGAAEEGSPFVPAHGMRRIAFVPRPSGFRFYHSHVVAGDDLNRGTYTGQAGPIYIEPKNNPGAYDREVFLVMKEFAPAFSRGGDMAMDMLAGAPLKAATLGQAQPFGLKAGPCARDAPPQTGRNHRDHHEGNRLASPTRSVASWPGLCAPSSA